MQDKSFKATTIVIPEASNRLVLEAAFNNWAEETKPASILHVHYYHDMESHVRGYQVVYEEPWALPADGNAAGASAARMLV